MLEKHNLKSIEVEGFYKNVSNRLDYIDGADLVANDAVEQVTVPGIVRAYGAEILVKKPIGKLQYWLAYTWSKSEQKTEGQAFGGPGINDGNWYPNAFDKRYDMSVNASYQLNNNGVLMPISYIKLDSRQPTPLVSMSLEDFQSPIMASEIAIGLQITIEWIYQQH